MWNSFDIGNKYIYFYFINKSFEKTSCLVHGMVVEFENFEIIYWNIQENYNNNVWK